MAWTIAFRDSSAPVDSGNRGGNFSLPGAAAGISAHGVAPGALLRHIVIVEVDDFVSPVV